MTNARSSKTPGNVKQKAARRHKGIGRAKNSSASTEKPRQETDNRASMKESSILAGALRASLSILSLQLKTMKEMSAEESAENVKTQTLINNAFKSFVKELLKEEASRFGPDSKAYKKKVLNMRDQLMKGIAEHMTEVAGEMEEDEDMGMESDFTDDLDSEESDATANKGDDVTEMEDEVES